MGESQATVMASPDTGCEENVISQELALKLGLQIEESEERAFRMANGKVVSCCGRTMSTCGFGTESHLGPSNLLCTFLSAPPWLRVRAIGKQKQRLLCSLDGEEVQVIADSGSEVDLISKAYAQQRGFSIELKEMNVMFADGSIGQTCGMVRAQLYIGACGIEMGIISPDSVSGGFPSEQPPDSDAEDASTSNSASELAKNGDDNGQCRNVLMVELHVLKDLVADVLIGEDSLESLNVFTQHLDDLTCSSSEMSETSDVHRIVLLGPVGQKVNQSKERVNSWMARAFGPKDLDCSDNGKESNSRAKRITR